ncbi:hypothetical protein [Paenibacillus sp. UNC451MF]|uniref:hypothetical protein n=1 Tax=Paenibacillus sp. UNC451MF TaxID=1449063 RepID=UPI00048FA229|nr:hypothetical protein [Paenibacillus sp. UNC451MF]
MKRSLIQAAMFSILFTVAYYAVQIGLGMYHTIKYVPAIVESYSSSTVLQSSVSFGAAPSSWSGSAEVGLLLVSGIVLFLLCKVIYKGLSQSMKKGGSS